MLRPPVVMSSSASFVVPLALIIAAVLMGWILYENISPSADNTRTTAPATQTTQPQPQSTPKPQ